MIWSDLVGTLCRHSYRLVGEDVEFQVFSSPSGRTKLLMDWKGEISDWRVSIMINNDLKDTWFLQDIRLVPLGLKEDSDALLLYRKDGLGYVLSDHLEPSY